VVSLGRSSSPSEVGAIAADIVTQCDKQSSSDSGSATHGVPGGRRFDVLKARHPFIPTHRLFRRFSSASLTSRLVPALRYR
jgi:hypothetical protein